MFSDQGKTDIRISACKCTVAVILKVVKRRINRLELDDSGHLTLRTFAHILSDPRTQDIPLVLETPAHDAGTASKGKRKLDF